MRATPPSRRMSAGTRSRAITATAPASSAIRASSALVTSMITPPFSISARPLFTRMVPSSAMALILARAGSVAGDEEHPGAVAADSQAPAEIVAEVGHLIELPPGGGPRPGEGVFLGVRER